MSVQEIVAGGGGALLVLMTLIQIAPIKVNPWSRLAKAFGRAINSDVLSELVDVKKHQQETWDKLDEHIRIDDERDADMRRQRILRFNADLMKGDDYNHEYFAEMLVEIDGYESYCEAHPNYKNNRAVMAIANIKRVYKEHAKNGDFV